MKKTGNAWERLGTPGNAWEHLGTPGKTWEYLGIPGNAWEHLGTPGNAWEHLGIPGNAWEHLGKLSQPFSAILSPSQSFPPPKKKSGTLKRESQNRELVITNCLHYCGLTSSDYKWARITTDNCQCYTAIRNNQR